MFRNSAMLLLLLSGSALAETVKVTSPDGKLSSK